MQSSILFLISLLSVVVNAHFQLQFPAPRGVFVENDEPNFCDGYNTAASNRTAFPLTGGFFTLNSEHPKWTSEVLLSTASNPTSFDNFSSVVPFFQLNGEGIFCIPLDFSKTNATGLKDGQNVTIQIVFDGGDNTLYQCADLTLSSNASISSVSCTNATDNSGGSSSSSASTPSSTGSPANSAVENSVPLMFASALGLVGIVSAFML